MKDIYNPLSLGSIQDDVGYIPAGSHNPEIYYTRSGEQCAAITLLTFLLMKQEVVEHLNANSTTVIASYMLDEGSEQILMNLKDGFPVGTIRDDAKVSREDKDKNLGRAYQGNILRINQDTLRGHTQAFINVIPQGFSFEKFCAEVEEVNDEPLEENLVAEEDDLYGDRVSLLDKGLEVSEVLEAINDPQKLVQIMARIQSLPEGDALKGIPQTICHETAHLYCIEKNVIEKGLLAHPTDAVSNFDREDYTRRNGVRLPDVLVDGAIMKALRKTYEQDHIQAEMEVAKVTAPKSISYYLSKSVEAKAELLGTVLLEDMEDTHHLEMHKSVLKEYMPQTYAHLQKYMAGMQPPTAKEANFDIGDYDPDERMADYAARQLQNSYDLK